MAHRKTTKRRKKEYNSLPEPGKTPNKNKSNHPHSKSGIFSCLCALVVLVVIGVAVLSAMLSYGAAYGFVGGALLLSVFLAIKGLRLGLRGRKERNCRYLTCRIGIISNSFFAFVIIIFYLNGLL